MYLQNNPKCKHESGSSSRVGQLLQDHEFYLFPQIIYRYAFAFRKGEALRRTRSLYQKQSNPMAQTSNSYHT